MRTQFLKLYKKNRRRGFTLIEIITAVGIFAILTAIAVPSVGGYMESSEMMKLNQTAKTLFLSAQDYLSQAASSGRLEEINKSATQLVDLTTIVPAVTDKERTANAGNIRYITLSKSGADSADLRAVLDPFVGDKSLLDQSILVEYNQNTGVVRSVFYSERADTLKYDGDITEKTNVISRQDADLRKKRQGYYGVDYTGELGKRERLTAPVVELVNKERLTVEWTDVTPSGALSMTYTLTIQSADMKTDYLRIEGIPSISKAGLPATMKDSETTTQSCSISYPATAVGTVPISVSKSADGKKVVVILDDIHQSMYDKFPSIPLGEIRATVEPVVSWILPTTGISQNQTNTYFGDNTKTTGNSTVYDIAYARHLDNMRHAPENSSFKQSATFDWEKPEDGAVSTPGLLFETINPCYRISGSENKVDAFKGTYDGGGFFVDHLKFASTLTAAYLPDPSVYDQTSNYGLFHKLDGATIKNAELRNPILNLNGYSNVGAFAGSATGAVLNKCKVENSESGAKAASVSGKEHVGGLIGKAVNTTFTDVANIGYVTGTGDYVGGLAGEMSGTSSIKSTSTQNRNSKDVKGGNFVGGLVGKFEGTEIQNGNNSFTVTGTGDHVGGLVGLLEKGTIEKGNFNSNSRSVTGKSNVGGIVGWNKAGTITNPIVAVSGDKDKAFPEFLKAMKLGTVTGLQGYVGVYGSGSNVGGLVGQNDGTVTVVSIAKDATVMNGMVAANGDNAGGLIGNNTATGIVTLPSATGAQHHSNGVVVSNGNYAGGIFGVNSNGAVKYDGLVSGSHVAANLYAGGIIGTNGTEVVKGAEISNCTVNGMVYGKTEYAGGIAGSNYGTISNCKSAIANAEALDSTIAKLGLAYGDFVGGIAGYNNGEIKECSSGNLVKGQNFVGGITGKNDTDGNLTKCNTTGGRVIATGNFAGGLMGLNQSTKQEFSDKVMGDLVSKTELVQGKYFVGGVIGCNANVSGTMVIQSSNGDAAAINKSSVIGEAYVGGIIGYNGKLSDDANAWPKPFDEFKQDDVISTAKTRMLSCTNYSTVSGVRYVGGIIGLNSADSILEIENNRNDGAISYNTSSTLGPADGDNWDGCYYIGGITGRNTAYGTIKKSINNGNISNRSKYTGGLVELNEGLISGCSNSGTVASTTNNVGGIAGANKSYKKASGKIALIENCIAASNSKVYGNSVVGGIVGDNTARIVDCIYDSGTSGIVQASGDNSKESSKKFDGNFAGGIAGYNGEEGRIVSTSTEKNLGTRSVSGTVKGGYMVGGIVGYSAGGTAEQKNSDSTRNTSDSTADPNEISRLTNGATVYGQYFTGGIVGYHGAAEIKDCTNAKSGIVVNTGGVTAKGAGRTSTTNSYEVKTEDKSVTVNLENSGAGGIVSYNPSTKTILNCVNRGSVYSGAAGMTLVESAKLTKAGGMVGLNDGEIKSCTNSGKVWSACDAYDYTNNSLVRNGDNAGGIAGINTNSISDCIAETNADVSVTAEISGRKNVGGLVGHQKSGSILSFTVNNKNYLVSGGGYVGGLVGYWQGGAITLANSVVSAKVEGKLIGTAGNEWTLAQPRAIGGVFGFSDNLIENFTFSGTVSGFQGSNNSFQQLGGIVGNNTNGVSECKLTGTVTNLGNTVAKDELFSGVGGIAGYSSAEIKTCELAAGAKVTGAEHVGGIVGYNVANGILTGVTNNETSTVETKSATAGGFIGYNTSLNALVRTETTKLVNLAKVTGFNKVGGIVGESLGNIAYCDNSGVVECMGDSGGGIAGSVSSHKNVITISNSNNYKTVNGIGTAQNIGGILGSNSSGANNALTIKSCKNEGTVEAINNSTCFGIGGIAGILNAVKGGTTITDCENGTDGKVSYSGVGYIYNTKETNNRQLSMGGLVGIMNGATVKNCYNNGDILIADTFAVNKAERVGGIIGEVKGSTSNELNDCSNQKNISYSSSVNVDQLGGLVGYANGNKFTILNSKNDASIIAVSGGDVGGLVGYLTANIVEINTSSNGKEVKSKNVAGGIVGRVYRYFGGTINTPVIKDCENQGPVTASTAGGILGLRDSHEVAVKIESCTNDAEISGTKRLADNNRGAVGGIVGSFGYNTKNEGKNEISACTNKGIIQCDVLDGYAMGGIVGSVSEMVQIGKVTVSECINEGMVGNSGLLRIGGIVGDGGSKVLTVEKCTNKGAVSALKANEIGGIVGRNGGSVIDSNNEAKVVGYLSVGGVVGSNDSNVISSSNEAVITGDSQVGGIVGRNNNQFAIVYTDTTKGKDITYCSNSGAIDATGNNAGGIVGENVGGGVAGVYNIGNVTAKSNAGGLIGRATSAGAKPDKNIAGTLVNSYSIKALVTSDSNGGGIIGEREDAYDSVGSHSIKYGMYIGTNPLAVGNEPAAPTGENVKKAVNDEPLVGDTNDNAFARQLIDKDFQDLLLIPNNETIADKSKDDLISLIQKRILVQPYVPPQPRKTQTVSDHGYSYTTSWEMVQGTITDYKVYLRPKDGTAGDKKDIYLGNANQGTPDPSGRLKTYLEFDLEAIFKAHVEEFKSQNILEYEDLIGLKYDIVVVTIGQEIQDPASSTKKALESDNQTLEEDRKFLPPLPTPSLENPIIGTNKIYTFKIEESTYKNTMPLVDQYRNLYKYDEDIYKEYYAVGMRNTTATFKAEDLAKNNQGKITIPVINPLTDAYQFTVDHNEEKVKTEHIIHAQALSEDTVNGYAHSEWGNKITYYLQITLPAPKGLTSKYVGTATTEKYDLKWGIVDNNSGYRVTISYDVMESGIPVTKTETVMIPKGAETTYQWIPPNIVFADTPNAKFCVETMGDEAAIPSIAEADRIYLTSEKSVSMDIILPVKLKLPVFGPAESVINEKGASGKIKWTHEQQPLVKDYTLTVFRCKVGDTVREKYPLNGNVYTLGAGEVERGFNFKDENDEFGYTYIYQLTANGDLGKSLTSDMAETTYTLYERLPTPIAVKVDEKSSKPQIIINWDEKQQASGVPYPTPYGGFELTFKEINSDSAPIIVPFTPATQSYNPVDEGGLSLKPGEQYQVSLQALGIAGSKSPSLQSDNFVFTMLKRIPNANNLKVAIDKADDELSFGEFGKVKHKVTWDAYSSDDQALMAFPFFNVKAFTGTTEAPIEITNEIQFYNMDDVKGGSFTNLSTGFKFSVPVTYAGKPIWFTVETVAGGEALNSEIVPSEQRTLPKAQLPTLVTENQSYGETTYSVLTTTEATNNIVISKNDALASVLAKLEADGRLGEYQMNFNIGYTVGNGTDRPPVSLNAKIGLENFIVEKGETPGVVVLKINTAALDLPTNLSRSERRQLEKEAEEREKESASSEDAAVLPPEESSTPEQSSGPVQSSQSEQSSLPGQSSSTEENSATEPPAELVIAQTAVASPQTKVMLLAAHAVTAENSVAGSFVESEEQTSTSVSTETSESVSTSSEGTSSPSSASEETAASSEASSSSASSENASASSEAVSSSPESAPEPPSSPAERAHSNYEARRASLLADTSNPSNDFNDDTTASIHLTSEFRPFRLKFTYLEDDSSLLRIVSVSDLTISMKSADAGLTDSEGFVSSGGKDAPVIDSGVHDSGDLDSGFMTTRSRSSMKITRVPFEIIYEDGEDPDSVSDEDDSAAKTSSDSIDESGKVRQSAEKEEKTSSEVEKPDADSEKDRTANQSSSDVSSSEPKSSGSRSVREKNSVSTGKYENLHELPS